MKTRHPSPRANRTAAGPTSLDPQAVVADAAYQVRLLVDQAFRRAIRSKRSSGRAGLARTAAAIVDRYGQRDVKRAVRAFKRRLHSLPLERLILVTEELYRREHASWSVLLERKDGEAFSEWVQSWQAEMYFSARAELDRRATVAVEDFMAEMRRALVLNDWESFLHLSTIYREWPSVFRSWAFAYFRPKGPEFEGGGWTFDLEPSEFLDVAVRLREKRKRSA